MTIGYRKTNSGEAYTFITLDMPINDYILDAVWAEIEQTCSDEQFDLLMDNLVDYGNDGYGSIRFQWETDYNGDIDPKLAKMLEDWEESGFWWELETIYDIYHYVGDLFWDQLENTDCEEHKAYLVKQHIETSLRYYPGDTPKDILEAIADWIDYDASTIMAEVLFVNGDKLAA